MKVFFEDSPSNKEPTKPPPSSSQPAEQKQNPILTALQAKEREVQNLQSQGEKIKKLKLTKEELIQQAKNFELKGQKGKLLTVSIPLEDRKILSDLSDSLLSALSSGVLIVLGFTETKSSFKGDKDEGKNQKQRGQSAGDQTEQRSEGKCPVIVNVTKNFQNFLSAGDILKNTVAPLCKGRGGGKASFAQGSVSDPSVFPQVEQKLLEQFSHTE